MNPDKAIILTNGPSFEKFIEFIKNNQTMDWREYCVITVNRWSRIFEIYSLPLPNVVIIGKNSLPENMFFLKNTPTIQFYGVEPKEKIRFKNYEPLYFGKKVSYGVEINHLPSLWWSGVYCIQWAVQREFKKIYVFGMTCTDQPDYKDNFVRAPIPDDNMKRIYNYMNELKKIPNLSSILFFEEADNHIFRTRLGLRKPSDDKGDDGGVILKSPPSEGHQE